MFIKSWTDRVLDWYNDRDPIELYFEAKKHGEISTGRVGSNEVKASANLGSFSQIGSVLSTLADAILTGSPELAECSRLMRNKQTERMQIHSV